MPLPTRIEFIPEDCFALLYVEKPEIPQNVRLEGVSRGYKEKSETHISVIVPGNSGVLKGVATESAAPERLLQSVSLLLKKYSWEYAPLGVYHLMEREYPVNGDVPAHIRRSIVERVELPDLAPFYDELNKLLGVSLTLPVPHITLFAWSDYSPLMERGIGISSTKEFEESDRGVI